MTRYSIGYPIPVHRRTRGLVTMYYYLDRAMAEEAQRLARTEFADLAKRGFQYETCDASIEVKQITTGEFAGHYEVCVP